MQLHAQSIKYIYCVAWNLRSVQRTLFDFVRLCWYASEYIEKHFSARNQTNIIQTRWFFKLRECSVKKRKFIFYRWKPYYKVFKYNRRSIGLTDFVRLCCNASECGEQHSSDIRRWRWRIDLKFGNPGKNLLLCRSWQKYSKWIENVRPFLEICSKEVICNFFSQNLKRCE